VSPLKRRALLSNVLLLTGSIAILFAGLEVAARLIRKEPGEPVAAQYTEFDPTLGWRHRPRAIAHFPQGDYAINSRGLRDQERALEAPPGTFRMMLLGDSFAEGFSVAFEDSAAQVLERSLTPKDCAIEVVAAGTVGYSTDQEYLFYRDVGARYQPRVVVLLFYYNDILYNARASVGRAAKPLLTFKGGTLRVQNIPLTPPPNAAPWWSGEPVQRPRLQSVDWLRQRLLTGAPRGYDAIASLGIWPKRAIARAGDELLVYSRNPPTAVRDALAQTLNILLALKNETAKQDARLMIVYVPSKMEVNERDWELTRQRYGVDDRTWDRRQVARWLRESSRDLGIPFVDPTTALEAQERGGRRATYHSQGGHWNAVGHAVAALAIETALRSSGVLPTTCGSGS